MSLEHLNFVLNLLAALVLPIGYFIWRQIGELRENDMKHLAERHQEILAHLTVLDEKINRHLDLSEQIHRDQSQRLAYLEGMQSAGRSQAPDTPDRDRGFRSRPSSRANPRRSPSAAKRTSA